MNLEDLIAEVLYVESSTINDESGPENIEAWDSLGHINIITAIEDEFDIEIEPEEIAEISKVRDIKTLLTKKQILLD